MGEEPNMPALHGIDVSHHNLFNQGPIDWSAVATTQPALEFVIARMSHGNKSDDSMRTDRQAANNRDGMRAAFADKAIGFYHFLGASTPAAQAQLFRSLVGELRPNEFVMLDVEPDDAAGVPPQPIEHVVATLEAIEQAFGRTPMVYIGLPYPGHDDPRLGRFPLVFPAYTNEARAADLATRMGRRPVIWQWGGGAEGATVAGIDGRVDSCRIEDMAAFRAALVPGGVGPVDGGVDVDPTSDALQWMPTLAAGAAGNAVIVLQGLLIEHGLFQDRDANRDGRFGVATDARVRRLQADHGLPATGVVDAATWAVLAEPGLVPA
jgi:GH25 family lysozyme M1 (1,4-beta-N-acetylmuramidase)